jgi:regulation of enolase protein 1 (concanavalin A-like superfamily)
MIVSVVTRGSSDDANSVPIDGNTIYLRLSKLENAYAFHYSHDGSAWNLVRHFGLGGQRETQIGFLSQSPTGEGCTAYFSEISYTPQLLGDLRSGE